MKTDKNLWKYCLMIMFTAWLFFSTIGGCFGQDTTKIEMCYSYIDCKIPDTTFEAIYNSHCIKQECGYIVENEYGVLSFLNKDEKPFAKSIVVWWYKKEK